MTRKTWHNSWTTLHRAAYLGDLEAVKSLLVPGAEIDGRASIDETPLFLSLNHEEVVEFLLAHGANVDSRRHDGWTPLHWTARHGQKKVLELLLRHGAQVNALTNSQCTPLHLSTARKDMAELLLAHGADVNATIDDGVRLGWTSLHLAAASGNKDVVDLLLAHDANVHALASWSVPGAQMVNITPLFEAVLNGHVHVATMLIANHAQVDATLDDGWTPLHFAASREMAEVLLAANAEIETKCKEGMTPMHTAAMSGHRDVVLTLLSHGAKLGERDENDATPFDLAMQRGHVGLAAILRGDGGTVSL